MWLILFRKSDTLPFMKDNSIKSEYITTRQAAAKWAISDRRVRVL
jgi:hypothetical protein